MESNKIFPQEIFDLIAENIVEEKDKEYLALVDPNIRKFYIKERKDEDYILQKIEENYQLKIDRNRYDLIAIIRIYDTLNSAFDPRLYEEKVKCYPNLIVLFDILDLIIFNNEGIEEISQLHHRLLNTFFDYILLLSKDINYNFNVYSLIQEKLHEDKYEDFFYDFLIELQGVWSGYTSTFPTTEKDVSILKKFIENYREEHGYTGFFQYPVRNIQDFYRFLEKNPELVTSFHWKADRFYKLKSNAPEVYKSSAKYPYFLSELLVRKAFEPIIVQKIEKIESFMDLFMYLLFASFGGSLSLIKPEITEEAKNEIDDIMLDEDNDITRRIFMELLLITPPLSPITEVITSIYSLPGVILEYITENLPGEIMLIRLVKLLFGKFDNKTFIKVLKGMKLKSDEIDTIISVFE